jgi:membrane protein CcdC involved in cytochrome C biogenesis
MDDGTRTNTDVITNPMRNTVGVVMLVDEHPLDVAGKLLAWITMMILFVIILVWFTRYFESKECEFSYMYEKHT